MNEKKQKERKSSEGRGKGLPKQPELQVPGLFCLVRLLPGRRFGLKGLDLAFCLLTDQTKGLKAFVILEIDT